MWQYSSTDKLKLLCTANCVCDMWQNWSYRQMHRRVIPIPVNLEMSSCVENGPKPATSVISFKMYRWVIVCSITHLIEHTITYLYICLYIQFCHISQTQFAVHSSGIVRSEIFLGVGVIIPPILTRGFQLLLALLRNPPKSY